ncbi:MAG TPA: proton-conducting transporter membrane subunit [Pedococcus sp.]|jgi:NADH-quinone oxidoreductase subunit N
MTTLVTLDWLVLAPVLAPAAGAVLVLLLDAVAPRLSQVHAGVGVLALVAGIALAVPGALSATDAPLRTLCLPAPDGACLYEAGPVASALQLGALASALVVLLLMWPGERERMTVQGGPAVVVCLVLAATAGACGVAAAHDLGSWLVCLELATLPVVALVALRGTVAAGRGALALLTTSLVSFAMLALGAALWLVATGEAVFAQGAAQAALDADDRRPVLGLAVVLLLAGLGFKLSLVPFHAWTPQAYAGGSEAVAAFLAATSKVAALAALVVVLRPVVAAGAPVLVAVGMLAAVSMTVGNLLALVQDDPVRLLAWSTVAQAGWVVLPLSALRGGSAAASGGYLLAYVIATLVAFAVVHVVGAAPAARGAVGAPRTLAAYTGLLRSHPLLGGALGLALLSLAGLPPGVVGLVAKVVALRPVVDGGQWVLALIAVANAVLGIAVYLRWFAVLLRDPEPAEVGPVVRRVDRPALAAVVLSGVALVATSVMPQLLLGLLG